MLYSKRKNGRERQKGVGRVDKKKRTREIIVFAVIVLALLARRRVTVTLDAPQTGVAHHACPLTVRVENASALPLPCVRVWLRTENLLTGQAATAALALSAPPKRSGESAVTLDDPLCGVYRLSVEKTRVCDLLGLVGFSAPPAERREFPVEPDLMELRLNLPLRTGVSDDSYTEIKSGLQEDDTVAYDTSSVSDDYYSDSYSDSIW